MKKMMMICSSRAGANEINRATFSFCARLFRPKPQDEAQGTENEDERKSYDHRSQDHSEMD
jgi:hypothetical protein